MIGVENKTVNRPNDNDDSVVVVEKGRETDQFNKNKTDQVADNKVSDDNMSESDYKMHMMNLIKTTMEDIMHNMNKRFEELNTILDERNETMNKGFDMMNKHFDELNTILDKKLDEREEIMNKCFDELRTVLDERKELIDKGFHKLKDVLDKQDEKWEGDIYRLKEDTGDVYKRQQ